MSTGDRLTPEEFSRSGLPRYPGTGRMFETIAGPRGYQTKEVLEASRHVTAALTTNESADNLHEIGIEARPDGYIYGVGAGAIFAMCLLFQADPTAESRMPLALYGCDLDASVVLTGRTAAELGRSSDAFESFHAALRSRNTFLAGLHKVIAQEPLQEIRETFRKVDEDVLFDDIAQLPQPLDRGYSLVGTLRGGISVLGAIRETWPIFKTLADEYNMGFVIGSLYDKPMQHLVTMSPGFSSSRNVIYGANLLDSVTYPHLSYTMGKNFSARNYRWQSLRMHTEDINTPNNTFMLSSVESDLQLFPSQGLPDEVPQSLWPQ